LAFSRKTSELLNKVKAKRPITILWYMGGLTPIAQNEKKGVALSLEPFFF
jgi:hypothetical protein